MVGLKLRSGCKTNNVAVRMENVLAKRRNLAIEEVSFVVAMPCLCLREIGC